jgi:hypothetical protein
MGHIRLDSGKLANVSLLLSHVQVSQLTKLIVTRADEKAKRLL